MGNKKIKNPIELRATFLFPDDGMPHVDTAKVCYGVSCDEHSIEEQRMLVLLENPEIRNSIKDFAEEAMEQIDVHEQIPEEDSLIEYPRPV